MQQAAPPPKLPEAMRGITVGMHSISLGISLDEAYRDTPRIQERV